MSFPNQWPRRVRPSPSELASPWDHHLLLASSRNYLPPASKGSNGADPRVMITLTAKHTQSHAFSQGQKIKKGHIYVPANEVPTCPGVALRGLTHSPYSLGPASNLIILERPARNHLRKKEEEKAAPRRQDKPSPLPTQKKRGQSPTLLLPVRQRLPQRLAAPAPRENSRRVQKQRIHYLGTFTYTGIPPESRKRRGGRGSEVRSPRCVTEIRVTRLCD